MRTAQEAAAFYASLPGKHLAAGVLVTDWQGRVLIVQPSYKPHWEIPGGVVEEGESPRGAALREVREELSIDVSIGSLLVIDWVPARPDRPDILAFVYDGGTLDDADARRIHLPPGELNAYGFVEIGSAVGLLSEPLENRVKTALRAKRLGRSIELEDGRPQIARELASD